MEQIKLIQNKVNPLVLPIIFADRLDFFKKRGVPVDLTVVDDFIFNAAPSFVDGDVTAGIGDLTFFFDDLEHGKDAILTSDMTQTVQLLVRKEITDYTGIKIGVARRGLFPFLIENDLKDLVPNAQIVWLDNTHERIAALKEHEIDGLVAINPFIDQVLEEVPSKVIWNLRNSNKKLIMWTFDRPFYLRNKEMVQQFHFALDDAAQYFNQQSPADKVRLASEVALYNQQAAGWVRDFSFEQTHNFPKEDFELMQDFLLKNKKITQKYDSETRIARIY